MRITLFYLRKKRLSHLIFIDSLFSDNNNHLPDCQSTVTVTTYRIFAVLAIIVFESVETKDIFQK